MEIDVLDAIPAVVSSVAACVSAFFAIRSQRLQKKWIANKSVIAEIGDLISQLMAAQAMLSNPLQFSDANFLAAINLDEVPFRVAKLAQHPGIAEKINVSQWELPIENLPGKIAALKEVRDKLL